MYLLPHPNGEAFKLGLKIEFLEDFRAPCSSGLSFFTTHSCIRVLAQSFGDEIRSGILGRASFWYWKL